MQKLFLISFLIIIGLFSFSGAKAAIVPCGTTLDPEPCTLCHFWELGSNVFNFIVFRLAVPFSIILFISAGVILVVSGGNEKRVGKAKEIFINTIIGLFILFCAWLLLETLIKTLVNESSETGKIIWAWNEFPDCP